MWVFSSFEVFLNLVFSSYSDALPNNERRDREEMTESIRLKELFHKFKWEIDEISYLLPVFDFFGLARHCIVHNMATASEDLIKLKNSEEFKNAINSWPTVIKGRKLSPAPEFDSNRKIMFNPHHAITYSDVCYRISKFVNAKIIQSLGNEYFVLKTTKETLLDKNELTKPYCRDAYAYINYQLKQNYNLPSITPTELREILEKSKIRKKVISKYAILKNI